MSERLTGDDRYAIGAWDAFATSYKAIRWTDSHDAELQADREKRAADEKARRSAKRAEKKKRRTVPPHVLAAIAAARDERAAILLALRMSRDAPRYISRTSSLARQLIRRHKA